MKHDETYHGHRIVVTTTKNVAGRWTARAELVDAAGQMPEDDGGADFVSEDEARRAGLSRAAAAIDRARQRRGKP
jgi:hypothetical protein